MKITPIPMERRHGCSSLPDRSFPRTTGLIAAAILGLEEAQTLSLASVRLWYFNWPLPISFQPRQPSERRGPWQPLHLAASGQAAIGATMGKADNFPIF